MTTTNRHGTANSHLDSSPFIVRVLTEHGTVRTATHHDTELDA